MRRTIAIGDIHGCRQALAELLAQIAPDAEQDTVIILGDLINRGPDSKGTVALLLELREELRHLIILRGNHEQMLLDFLADRNRDLFLRAGGLECLTSYDIDPFAGDAAALLPPDHLALLSDLPATFENEHGIFVHAGLEPGIHLSHQSPQWLLWARDEFINCDHNFGKPVIFGHTPFEKPLLRPNKIGIDTGAVYGGSLTALILPEMRLISVPTQPMWPRPFAEPSRPG
ncbi:MAG: serine/threonine protein phosphatase [Desulfobulbaceae bacterium]|nr:MAG: serine/threonine protein phosphatase [Desulfobulbaceae bacterium]